MVIEREEGVVALHLPIGPLKASSGLEPVPRCEPVPTSLLVNDLAIGAGTLDGKEKLGIT